MKPPRRKCGHPDDDHTAAYDTMITRRRTAFCLNLLALLAHAELGLDDARRAAQDELRGRTGITAQRGG